MKYDIDTILQTPFGGFLLPSRTLLLLGTGNAAMDSGPQRNLEAPPKRELLWAEHGQLKESTPICKQHIIKTHGQPSCEGLRGCQLRGSDCKS